MLIDSHCHFDFPQFDHDREQLMQQAMSVGVKKIIIPGIEQQYWQRQISLCRHSDMFSFALGIHPFFLNSFKEHHINELEVLLAKDSPVAIGECGVDGTVEDIKLQTKVFQLQIHLANQFKLPLIIHHRKSHHLIFSSFKQVKPNHGGVIHAFSGSLNDAKKYTDLGFKLGIGGVITYPRATKTIETIQAIGLSNLVLETDAPDMPLKDINYENKLYRNEPANVAIVAQSLATILNQDVDLVRQITSQNSNQLFNL